MLKALTGYSKKPGLPKKRNVIFAATAISAAAALLIPTKQHLIDIFFIINAVQILAIIIISLKAKNSRDIIGLAGLVLFNLLSVLCFEIFCTKFMIKSQQAWTFVRLFDIDIIKKNLFAALVFTGIFFGMGLHLINKMTSKMKIVIENMLHNEQNGFELREIKLLSSVNEVNKVLLFLYITGIFILAVNIVNSTAKGAIKPIEANIINASAKTFLCLAIATAFTCQVHLLILMLCINRVISKIFSSKYNARDNEPKEAGESFSDDFKRIYEEKRDLLFEDVSWADAEKK